MTQNRISIVDYDYPDIELEKHIIEEAGCSLVIGHAKTEEDVIAIAQDADGIIDQYAPITRKVLSSLSRCKVVSRYGIGVDTIDYNAATDLGIVVCNVPDYCIQEVSNHALALILGLSRRIVEANRQVKQGMWDFNRLTPILAAEKSTLGIIGLGNIGKSICVKAKALGYHCIASDPYIEDSVFCEYGAEKVSLSTLYKQSDVVSLHVPHTDETDQLINEVALSQMKNTAFLINTSRGKIIDQKALCHALKTGVIAGAGIDVLVQEPPDSTDTLTRLDNAIITPHIAYYSEDSYKRMRRITTESAVNVLRGMMPYSVVNKKVLQKVNLVE